MAGFCTFALTFRRVLRVSGLFRGGIANPGAFHRGTGDLGVRTAGFRGSGQVSVHREPLSDRQSSADLPVGSQRVQSTDARVLLPILPGLSASLPRARDLRRQLLRRVRLVIPRSLSESQFQLGIAQFWE